jgi:chromosome segregation ATPase
VETEKNALANQIQQFVQNKTEFQGRIEVLQEKSLKKSEKLKKWKEKETNLLKKIEVEKEDEIRLTTRATKFEQDIIESQKEISNLQTEIKDLQSSLQDAVAQIAEKERIIEDLLQQQRAFQVKKVCNPFRELLLFNYSVLRQVVMLVLSQNEIENELSNKFPELTNKLKLLLQKLTLLEKHEILYSATANSANQKTKELVTILNDLKSQITERDKLYQNCKADWEALVKEQNVRITAIEEINKEIEFFHQKRQVIENELDRHRKRLISIQSYLKKLHSQQTVSVFEKV